MGPKHSQIQSLDIDHPYFRNAKLIKQGTDNLIEVSVPVHKKQYDLWHSELKKSSIKGQFLFIPKQSSFKAQMMCGETGQAKLIYPYFPVILHDQIEDRLKKKMKFNQTELWYLLFSLASAKANMKPQNNKVGDIRPHNVFINEHNQIRVANMHSWPLETTNFTKALKNQKTYLAPEEVIQLAKGHLQHQNNELSQTFSIGLTVLSAAVLKDLSNIYDLKNNSINETLFKQHLDDLKIEASYSQILKSTISNLCKFDPTQRMLPDELWKLLHKHEDKIKAKQIFTIDEAPQKLHNQVHELRQYLPLLLKSFNLANINLLPKIQDKKDPEMKSTLPPRIQQKIIKKESYGPANYTRSVRMVAEESPVKKI